MLIDASSGLINGVHYLPSPNCDLRPEGCDINLLVIHNISLPPGEFSGNAIDQLFTNTLNPHEHPYFETICQLRVSSHVLIRRSGEIIQYVPFHLRAWHAGESCFGDQHACNDFSIGIELEGTDDLPYTDAQYDALISLCRVLITHYSGITKERITGHCDIAPGRKTDPGPAFDWDRLLRYL